MKAFASANEFSRPVWLKACTDECCGYQGKLATGNGRAISLASSDKPVEEKIRELYIAAFSREPRADELKVATDFLAEPRVDAAGNGG